MSLLSSWIQCRFAKFSRPQDTLLCTVIGVRVYPPSCSPQLNSRETLSRKGYFPPTAALISRATIIQFARNRQTAPPPRHTFSVPFQLLVTVSPGPFPRAMFRPEPYINPSRHLTNPLLRECWVSYPFSGRVVFNTIPGM